MAHAEKDVQLCISDLNEGILYKFIKPHLRMLTLIKVNIRQFVKLQLHTVYLEQHSVHV